MLTGYQSRIIVPILTQKIVKLDLRSNRIGDQGAKYIADALRNNSVSSICLSLAFDLHSTCRLCKNLIYDQTISQKLERNIYTTHCEITRLVFCAALLLVFNDYFFTQTLTKLYLTGNSSAHCDALETVISMKNEQVIEDSVFLLRLSLCLCFQTDWRAHNTSRQKTWKYRCSICTWHT